MGLQAEEESRQAAERRKEEEKQEMEERVKAQEEHKWLEEVRAALEERLNIEMELNIAANLIYFPWLNLHYSFNIESMTESFPFASTCIDKSVAPASIMLSKVKLENWSMVECHPGPLMIHSESELYPYRNGLQTMIRLLCPATT